MEGILMMSQKEQDRIKLLEQVERQEITIIESAKILSVSERQLYRILRRYRNEGDRGVIHRLRGRPSNRGYSRGIREQVCKLYWKQYADYGPTLFSEMLVKNHSIDVNHETVRRWLMASGGTNVQRKKRPHRRKRERRSAIGELLQIDGSHHDWFEGRGPSCCLLHAIDDASGLIFLRFAPSENSHDALLMLRKYCELHGIPRAVYVDRGSVFYAEKKLTDVGRALRTFDVELIFANSPQAKGRVERGNRTHQDRLIKALRRENISNIHEANRYLDSVYINEHNNHFASTDSLPDIHRSIEGFDLNNIFCHQTERYVYNDYTITLDTQYIQLLRSDSPLPPPRRIVTLRRWLDGSLHIFWNKHELNYEFIKAKPKRNDKIQVPPSGNHPWRLYRIGKAKRVTVGR